MKVNLLIGRFQPFTFGHLKCCEWAMNEKGVPTLICIIDTKSADSRHPFLTDKLEPIFKDMSKSEKCVAGFIRVKSANIVDITAAAQEAGFEPISWTCGSDRIDSYKRMAERYKEDAGLPDDFEVLEIPRTDDDISATKVRQALKSNDDKTFKNMTPKAWHKYYNMLRSEIMMVKESMISLSRYIIMKYK